MQKRMREPNRAILWGICMVVTLTLLSACSTFAPEATETLVPTRAPTDTPTEAPTATQTQTPLPSATNPPAPIPTIPVEERSDYFLKLLSTNGGCELPCWWGLNPGESMWNDLSIIYGPLGVQGDFLDLVIDGNFYDGLSINPTDFGDISINFYGLEETIDEISIRTELRHSVESPLYFPPFLDAISKYSVESIFNSYGIPSRILIYLRPGSIDPGGSPYFQVWVFYDDLGILFFSEIVDNMSINPNTGKIRACLSYNNTILIYLYLKSPTNNEPLEITAGRDGTILANPPRPIEEISGMTTEDFFKIVNDPTVSDKCFESPGDIWP